MDRGAFVAKVEKLAAALEYEIAYWHDSFNCARLNKACRQFFINNERDHRSLGRFYISSMYPKAMDGSRASGLQSVEISMDERKPATQMAKEIRRRFMPKYLENFKKAVAFVMSQDSFIRTRRATIRSIAALAGVDTKFMRPNDMGDGYCYFEYGTTTGDITSDGADRLKMKLGKLTIDQAWQIVQLLRE